MQTKFFGTPFAALGDRLAVPDAQQVDGSVSYAQGFGPDYEADPLVSANAKPVPRDSSNQIYYDLSSSVGALQRTGTPEFITAADNGGVAFTYALGARVLYGSPLRVYVSRKDANASLPSVAADWQPELFEAATDAQAIAGTPGLIVTPPALQAAIAAAGVTVPDATQSVKGIQRNATQAEANALSLGTASVTPQTLGGAIDTRVPAASTVVAGKVRLATVGEAGGGSATLAVTPAGLQSELSPKAPSASPSFTGSIAYGIRSFNVSNGRTTSSSASVGSFNTLSLIASGPYGGGIGLEDGNNNIGLLSVSGDLAVCFGAGSGALDARIFFQRTGAIVPLGGFQNGSSRTVKDHVGGIPPEEGLRNILALRPVRYAYTLAPFCTRRGYYAEDVAEVIPEAVTEADSGFSPLLLEDAQMLPDHTAAVQALHAMVVDLSARLAQLERNDD